MTAATDAEASRQRPWPRREGRSFFLLWLAGAIVSAVASRIIWSAITISQAPSAAMDQRWLAVLPSVALGVWQGWLLFSPDRKVRWALWTAFPVLHAVAPYLFRSPSPMAMANTLGFAALLTTIVGSLLLRGVRLRPWLWLFIQLGALVLNQVFIAMLYFVFGFPTLDRFGTQLNSFFNLSAPFVLSGSYLFNSVTAGLWLIGTVLAAYALTWWMPPLRKTSVVAAVDAREPSPLP